MTDIISQLSSQLGIPTDQATAGAGAIMTLIKDQAPDGDFQELVQAVPDASNWIGKAAPGPGSGSGIGGMVGGLMGGLGGGGAAGLIGLLGQSGISGGTAAKFLPLFLNLIKGQAGNALFGKILGAVPMLKEAAGGEGGQGALAGLLS